MNKERVDVRVEPELLEELDAISERMGIESRSAAIREAIFDFVMDGKETWNATSMKVSIPNRIAERLQRLVMNGDANDAQSAIVIALETWIKDTEDYHLRRSRKLDAVVVDNISKDGAMRELRDNARKLGGL